jgi:HK97 family phage portal protein
MADLRRAFAPLPTDQADHWRLRQSRLLAQRTQARTIPDMDMGSSTVSDLLLRSQGLITRPWRAASIREALGVPAIFGACNLIANTTGSLTMRALRQEVEVPPDRRPRLIIRPDPFASPREFYRQTAWNLATRGEAWWWVAARDIDGMPLSIINVNPTEVVVTEDPDDLRYPILKWRDRTMNREDFRQLVWAKDSGSLRGAGPLQMCGAAISVAVEAQEWAANFYADGGLPSTIVKTRGDLAEMSEADMAALKAQWQEADHNTIRFIDDGIESVESFNSNSSGAQMLESRAHQNIDVATMFNMDAPLLNAAVAGSSLTYQNVGQEFEKFLRMCLRPNILETIEQTMSDFLPRSIVARFNTAALTLADIKTRYDVYGVGIDKGIIDQEEARKFEGLAPGDVENAAVPYSPPAAVPTRLPIQMRTEPAPVRCDGTRLLRGLLKPCNKLLAERGPFVGTCDRCGKKHEAAA